MQQLNKTEAIAFVRERAAIFNASSNPFAKSAWMIHFIEQIVEPDWTIFASEYRPDECLMLLYSKPQDPDSRQALTNYYASLYSPLVGRSHDS